MKVEMKRRTFVSGALSVPVAITAGQLPSAEAVNTPIVVEKVAQKPLTMMSFEDCNMAGFEWRWDFVLKRSSDGTFSMTATQYDKWAEEGEEPWELDPHQSLRNGREICAAAKSMVDEAGYYADAEYLERIAVNLDAHEPALATEFRSEILKIAGELGWER